MHGHINPHTYPSCFMYIPILQHHVFTFHSHPLNPLPLITFPILYTHPSKPPSSHFPLFFTCMNLACMATHHTLHARHAYFLLMPTVKATSSHYLSTLHALTYSFFLTPHTHFSHETIHPNLLYPCLHPPVFISIHLITPHPLLIPVSTLIIHSLPCTSPFL